MANPDTTPYPITGYWTFPRRENEWQETLKEIKKIGGNKVIQFGPFLRQRCRAEIIDDEIFRHCTSDGEHHWIDVIEGRLRALNNNNRLRHIYTLLTKENFANDLTISRLDARIESPTGEHLFWAILISSSNPEVPPDFQQADTFDLVLVSGQEHDSVTELLETAESLQIDVFIGMPAASHDPFHSWDIWQGPLPVFWEVLKSILQSYSSRHSSKKAFVGVYQSFEMHVASSAPNIIEMYKKQHTMVRDILPNKKILLSPYWDARKNHANGRSEKEVYVGFKNLALKADVDIIAPQDGRGTGKVGLFWPHEVDKPVSSWLSPIVGDITYGDAYQANTQGFYKACREAVIELAADGVQVELWTNIEAFEPEPGIPCGSRSDRQRTNKERLDKAIMFAGDHASTLISFMWSYYRCKAGQDHTLQEQIEADWTRPIIVQAFRWESGDLSGIIIRGYNIVSGSIRLTYYDATWKLESETISVESGWISPDFGAKYNREHNISRYPKRLQEIWVPFSWENLAPNFWLHIVSVDESRQANSLTFSLKYISK